MKARESGNHLRLGVVPVCWTLLAAALGGISPASAASAASAAIEASETTDDLHAEFSSLLGTYVDGGGVRYLEWSRNPEDVQRLSRYVDSLEGAAVEGMERDAALAYWINLYNAVTLELVLSHYPVDSIKDTAGFLKSPWKKKLVRVEGEDLSLNAIENDIIRPRFGDPRIHFALNCASVGCPPIAGEAYLASRLDEQLDRACRRALNDPGWVRVEGNEVLLTKIFDWYGDDFAKEAGSVVAFIARFRPDGSALLEREEALRIRYADYDWNLNQAR